jgi:hypothetical protein
MKKYLVNYSDITHKKAQQQNTQTAIDIAKFDNVFSFNRNDIDQSFIEKNKHILDLNRGAGYWMWKPYVIKKALELIEEDEILFYSDSGLDFIKPIDELIPFLDKTSEGLLLFGLEDCHINKRWTKRDCFVLMGADNNEYTNAPQILASYVMLRKNKFTISFIDEWLLYVQDYRVVTDSPNECGLPNYPEFQDHRHDQSILSILGLKYKIKIIPDIGQYGSSRCVTSQIINHHRSNN